MKENYNIKKVLQACSLLLLVMIGTNVSAQVGIGTTAPAAALDITSTNEGFLIPRVLLTGASDISTVLTRTPSELVYNTNTVSGANGVTPGYYYLNETATGWIRLATGENVTPGWSLTGNTSIDPNANFLGTRDGQPLIIKTDNTERMRVISTGNVGIGSTVPSEKLEISNGNIFLNGTARHFIKWAGAGTNPPALGTSSVGTKLLLYPAAATLPTPIADYAIGVENGSVWYGVPSSDSGYSHKFYGGTTPLMTIRGDGNVGIGTSSPTTKLDISSSTVGAIKIVDGTQGNGKVLQSDANGVASWVLGTGFGNVQINAIGTWVCPWTTTATGSNFNTGLQVVIPTNGWYIFETGIHVQSDCNDYWLYIEGVGDIWRTYCAVSGVQYNNPREQSRILFINSGTYAIKAGKTLAAYPPPSQCAPTVGNPSRYIRFVKVQN